MIGSRIAALRKNAHMSQSELARILRISPSTVGMYEQGRREPSAATLVALAKLFQVSTDYLLTGKPLHTDDAQALARILENCVGLADQKLEHRRDRPFTRQELAVLFAAILMEP